MSRPQSFPVLVARGFCLVLAAISIWLLFTSESPGLALDRVQAAFADGKKVDLDDATIVGLFGAAACSLVIALFLVILAPWWARRPATEPKKSSLSSSPAPPRFFFLALLGISVLALGLRLPLAAKSLWWDEIWNIKFSTVGYFKPKTDSVLENEYRFLKRDWQNTVWNYHKPTNHPLFSIFSKVSLDAWRVVSGREEGSFHEIAARFPSLAATVASVFVLGFLLLRWRLPWAGVVAALLLAIHPWHIRYGVDARAYSLIVLIIAAQILTVSQMLSTDRWRWWVAFALLQWWTVWALPIGVFYAAAFAIFALVITFIRRNWLMAGRVLAMNAFAAVAFLFSFAPNALQMLAWGEINDYQFLDRSLLISTFAQLFTGIPSHPAGNFPSLQNQGIPALILIFAIFAIALWGLFTLFTSSTKGHRSAAGLLLTIILAGVAMLGFHAVQSIHFYPRYLIYLLPAFVIPAGIGICQMTKSSKIGRVAVAGLSGLFLWICWPQYHILLTRPYSGFRDCAEFAKQNLPNDAVIVGYGLGSRMFPLYLRDAKQAHNLAELQSSIEEARDASRPFFLFLGYREFNSTDDGSRDGFALIDQPGTFREIFQSQGIEPLFTFQVLALDNDDLNVNP